MFDRPDHVRHWFELTIRDQLALGRPDQVQIVFGRKVTSRTPGRFRTRVIDDGVQPQMQAHYKHCKVKQYLKEGRALRTQTTINDPYDFGVGRTLNAENWPALTRIGHQVNERLMAAQLAACDCAPDSTTLAPCRVAVDRGRPTSPRPALRRPPGDGTVLLPVLIPPPVRRAHQQDPARTRRRAHPGLQRPPDDLRPAPPAAQRPHPPHPRTQRYELTDHGRRIAVFFTKTYTRILNPSLTELDPTLPDDIAQRSPLARAWRAYEKAIDQRIADTALKAP